MLLDSWYLHRTYLTEKQDFGLLMDVFEGREGVLNEHFISLNCTEDTVNYKAYGWV